MNHKDYSYINNIDDLKREISAVKIRIRQNRSQLEQRWQRMPAELVRKTGGSVAPLLLNKSIAFNSWQLIRSGINYFLSQRTLSSKKNEMKAAARRVGLSALVFGLFALLKKRN